MLIQRMSSVQAELGQVAYLAEMESNPDWDKLMTNPLEAKWLVEETGVDALAVSHRKRARICARERNSGLGQIGRNSQADSGYTSYSARSQ